MILLPSKFEARCTPEPMTGCLLWTGRAIGYEPYLRGTFHWQGHTVAAHRFALYCATGYFGDKACHRCDNTLCVNHVHLFWGSQGENLADAREKGRLVNKGNAHYGAQLTSEQALRIASTYCRGMGAKFAAEFGVSLSTVMDVVHGRTWAAVTGLTNPAPHRGMRRSLSRKLGIQQGG